MDSQPYDFGNLKSQLKMESKALKKHQEKSAEGEHFTESEIVAFKSNIQGIADVAKESLDEIDLKITEVASSIQDSPWVPTEYSQVVNKGLLANQVALQEIISQADDLLEQYKKMPRIEDRS